MKHKILPISVLLLILSYLLGACRFQTPPITIESTTIRAAENLPDTPSPEPTIAYRKLAEADLALLIHQTIGEGDAAVKASSMVMMAAMSDNRLTEEEIAEALIHMQTLQSESRFAQELIGIYTDQYGELADETMDLLLLINENLTEITTSSNEVSTILKENKKTLSAENNPLEIVWDAIVNQSAAVNEQAGSWVSDVQAQIEAREKFYANTQPQLGLVAYNRIDAFTQAHDFLDMFTAALSDEKLSSAELAEISQLAATAKSSLYNTGDHQLFTFAQQINNLSRQASRGEWTQASSGLVELKLSLPSRPRP